MDEKLNFKEHFRYVQDKVEKVKRALCKLMPNLRGPHENKRRLYAYVVQSVVMYGAPIWYEGFAKNISVQRPLQRVQRQLANRIVAGYRTVAYEVAILLARTPPWALVARRNSRIFEKVRKAKMDKIWNKDMDEEVKEEEEVEMWRAWKRRAKVKDLPGQKLRVAIIKRFDEWMRRGHGGLTYHLTQLLTGHGCFNGYLQRIKKMESAMCSYCEGYIDNAEHTIMECTGWEVEREILKEALDGTVNMDSVVEAICTDKEKWQAVNNFATKVMSRKEEDERREKQRRAQEANEGEIEEGTGSQNNEEHDTTRDGEAEVRESENMDPEDERDYCEEDETWDPGG